MATKQQPGKQPDSNQTKEGWVPPRGIRYGKTKASGQKRFPLHWRDENGKRESESYETEKQREIAAKALAEKRQRHGSAVLMFDPDRWKRYLEFHRIVGEDVDPIQVGIEWRAHRQGIGVDGAVGMLVPDAFTKYRERRAATEKLAADTWRHIDTHVGKRFCGAFKTWRLNDIKAADIRTWIAGLKSPRTGEPLDARTKNHHRKDVNQFFEWCRLEGMIVRNPCELVEVLDVDEGEIVVISPEDAFAFFKANIDEPVIYRVAMEAFGGIRYKTAGRIQKSNFNFVERGIEMPGAIHKATKRKFRQGHPSVLWSYLDAAPEAVWNMTLLNYRERKRGALIRAGLRPLANDSAADAAKLKGLRNIWRHSFASYLLAVTKNFQTVSYLMQHKNASTTEKYEGVATQRNGLLYLSMTRDAVARFTWPQFEEWALAQTKLVPLVQGPSSPVDDAIEQLAAAGR